MNKKELKKLRQQKIQEAQEKRNKEFQMTGKIAAQQPAKSKTTTTTKKPKGLAYYTYADYDTADWSATPSTYTIKYR